MNFRKTLNQYWEFYSTYNFIAPSNRSKLLSLNPRRKCPGFVIFPKGSTHFVFLSCYSLFHLIKYASSQRKFLQPDLMISCDSLISKIYVSCIIWAHIDCQREFESKITTLEYYWQYVSLKITDYTSWLYFC